MLEAHRSPPMPLAVSLAIARVWNGDAEPVVRVALVLWRLSRRTTRHGFDRITTGITLGQLAKAAGCSQRRASIYVRVLRVARVVHVEQPPPQLVTAGPSGFACNAYFWPRRAAS